MTAFHTVEEVANQFRVSKRTIQRFIERGELSAVRLGPKLLRIPPEAIAAFEARLCLTTASNDQPSTGSLPASGTSSGPKADARIVSLQRRMTR